MRVTLFNWNEAKNIMHYCQRQFPAILLTTIFSSSFLEEGVQSLIESSTQKCPHRIHFVTGSSELDIDIILQTAEAFFELVGITLLQSPQYLEEFYRNASVVSSSGDPRPPVIGENFLRLASQPWITQVQQVIRNICWRITTHPLCIHVHYRSTDD